MPHDPRIFAVVPAAGHSRRMGRPKLLLKLHGETVISRLLSVLGRQPVVDVVVVARQADTDLIAAVRDSGGSVVTPASDPPDMRASVEAGLADLERRFSPDDDDVWLLVPADHPVLDPAIVPDLLAVWQTDQPDILIPTHGGRRGHPALIRWSLTQQISTLPANRGLNALRELPGVRVMEHPVQSPGVMIDLDTPQDWERLSRLPISPNTNSRINPSSHKPNHE